jgi:hypothetical protein
LGERLNGIQEVGGSTPPGSTSFTDGRTGVKDCRAARPQGGAIQEAVRIETMKVLTEIDLDETAEEVFLILDSIDVQDC